MVAYLFRDLSIRTSQEGKDVCSVVVHPLLCVITYQTDSTASKLAGVLLLTTEVSSLCCVSQVSEQSSDSFCSVNMIDRCYFWSVFEKGLLYESVFCFFFLWRANSLCLSTVLFPIAVDFCALLDQSCKVSVWENLTYTVYSASASWSRICDHFCLSRTGDPTVLLFSFPIYFWLCVQWINVWLDGMMTISLFLGLWVLGLSYLCL